MVMLDHPGLPDLSPHVALTPEPACSLVVIGASAGGIAALIGLLGALPADFPLSILVVLHLAARPAQPSNLPAVLGWRTRLRVKWAEDDELIVPGTVYLAPADQHLVVRPGDRLGLSSAARFGWWRPAVDVLFQSAAEVCGERVAAIVLSGMMWDGAKGIEAVAKRGGITIAQDEATAAHFDMPAAALDFGRADLMMSPQKIAQALQVLAAGAVTSAV